MNGRWVIWALLASLAVNLLIVGALIGARLGEREGRLGGYGAGAPDARDGGRLAAPEIAALALGLDRARRREVVAALRADPALRDRRARLAEGRGAVAAALRAEPFDPAALVAALEAQRARQDDVARRGFAALAEVVAGMDAAERAALAERVEAFGGRRYGPERR